MVHTLPGGPASASNVVAGNAGSSSGDVEKFSGLKISDRQLRAARFEELMRGKRYVPFDRLSSLESPEDGSKDAVMIGVLYEKSLMKTGSTGNQYVQWSFTDLAFPQPNVQTLFLFAEAFDTWEKDTQTPVSTGTIFAMLNPVPLPSRGGDSARRAAKVNYGTQLVRLGVCPSLAFCSCHKKDGLKCSMPCDRDKGPLVCFYHTMQQAAQKTKQWNKPGSSAGADGIFVLQAPARPVPNISQNRGGTTAAGLRPGTAHQGITNAHLSATSRPATAPQSAAAPTARLSSVRGNANASGGIDAVTARLLSGPNKRPLSGQAASRSVGSGPLNKAATASNSVAGGRALPTPARLQVPAEFARSVSAAAPSEHEVASASANARHANKERFAAQRIQRQFPAGIPEPDPNNPLRNCNPVVPPSGSASARNARIDGLLAATARSVPPTQTRRGFERQPQAAPRGPTTPIVMSASGLLAAAASAKKSGAPAASVERRRAQKEFGSRAAAQLDVADPRKDLVRQQGSRFAAVVEQERVAKRHRQLSELEAQDAMAEKMEAIMEMTVQAWKCQQCVVTTESQRAKAACEEQGHTLVQVTAKKTRWECKGCSFDVFVLDRAIPNACSRCHGFAFRPGPLRKASRAAPMEKDGLLARGEELKYINSIHIPGAPPLTRHKEATDDYAGL